MAKGVTVRVDGLRELGAKLQALGLDMTKDTARKATGVAAGLVAETAKARVPVKTGLLKSQIITKRIPPGQAKGLGATSMHIVTVRQGTKRRKGKMAGVGAPHAHLVEFGTVHSAPQPFLRPALDENVSRAIDAMASVIRTRVEKA